MNRSQCLLKSQLNVLAQSYLFSFKPNTSLEGKDTIRTCQKNINNSLRLGRHKYTHYLIICDQVIFVAKRQAECIQLRADNTINQIVEKLNLSPRTIEFYLSILKTKLNCQTTK